MNDKYKGVKLENIILGDDYAFSLNPSVQPVSTDRAHVLKWYRSIYDHIFRFRPSVGCQLFMEVSPIGRYHFHGKVSFVTHQSYISFVWYMKLIGSFEIDTMSTSDEVWDIYIRKQAFIWMSYFNKCVIPYPMDNRTEDIVSISSSNA